MRPLVFCLALCGASLPLSTAAVEIAPHRAVYRLDIVPGTALAAAGRLVGQMVVELSDRCEEWRMVTTLDAALVTSDGETLRFGSRDTAWESKDGRSFRFTSRSEGDLLGDEREAGEAELGADGSGVAEFQGSSGAGSIPLPQGTLLPVAHMKHWSERFADGEPIDYATVFLGRSPTPLLDVSAVVVRALPPGHPGAVESELLDGVESWQITAAWYEADDLSGLPVVEATGRYYANGVSEYDTFSMGPLVMRLHLVALEPLSGECG